MATKDKKSVKKTPKASKIIEVGDVEVSTEKIMIGVVDTTGKALEQISISSEMFGTKMNEQLIAQAIRVYLANQRAGSASTKTRGEVRGSTRKIYRQKGTGKARHGAIRAPIFVGGGIVFGPHPKDFSLKFSKPMKRKSLAVMLSKKFADNGMIVVDGVKAMTVKTKVMCQMFEAIGATKKTLFVVDNMKDEIVRAAKNLPKVDIVPASHLTAFHIYAHPTIVWTKEAITSIK